MSTDDRETVGDAQLDATADKLSTKYAGEDGPFTEDEVAAAVYDAAEELHDAPVQTFVPLLAENKARAELHDRKEHQSRAIAAISWPQCG